VLRIGVKCRDGLVGCVVKLWTKPKSTGKADGENWRKLSVSGHASFRSFCRQAAGRVRKANFPEYKSEGGLLDRSLNRRGLDNAFPVGVKLARYYVGRSGRAGVANLEAFTKGLMTLRKNKKLHWVRGLDAPEEDVVIAFTPISKDSEPKTIAAL
jgi:hypothetical protein